MGSTRQDRYAPGNCAIQSDEIEHGAYQLTSIMSLRGSLFSLILTQPPDDKRDVVRRAVTMRMYHDQCAFHLLKDPLEYG